MENAAQPFVSLTTANIEAFTRFAQSPEINALAQDLAKHMQDLAQQTFMRAANTSAFSQFVSDVGQNYARFAQEYARTLVNVATESQQQFTQQFTQAQQRLVREATAA